MLEPILLYHTSKSKTPKSRVVRTVYGVNFLPFYVKNVFFFSLSRYNYARLKLCRKIQTRTSLNFQLILSLRKTRICFFRTITFLDIFGHFLWFLKIKAKLSKFCAKFRVKHGKYLPYIWFSVPHRSGNQFSKIAWIVPKILKRSSSSKS